MLQDDPRGQRGRPAQAMAASSAEGRTGEEIVPKAGQAVPCSRQVDDQDPQGVVIHRLLLLSSRETGAARSVHRAVRDRAHPVVSELWDDQWVQDAGASILRAPIPDREVQDPSGGP